MDGELVEADDEANFISFDADQAAFDVESFFFVAIGGDDNLAFLKLAVEWGVIGKDSDFLGVAGGDKFFGFAFVNGLVGVDDDQIKFFGWFGVGIGHIIWRSWLSDGLLRLLRSCRKGRRLNHRTLRLG